MDFLNQAFAQINNVFRSLSVGARIMTGLLVVLVVVSLAFLFNRQLASPESFLFGGEPVSAAELPGIEAAFGKAGLKNYAVEGNRIRVPRGEESSYMVALAEGSALPANAGSYFYKALDGGFWESKSKQAERSKYSMQMELGQMISKMQGVENANVIYDIKEEGGLNRKKIYSASVGVKTLGRTPLEEQRVQAIRHLVAAAFAGMAPESVAVTDLSNNRVFPAGRPGEVASGSMDPYNQTKASYEKTWTEKIREALAYVPGAIVAVNVQLNPHIEETEHSIKYESKTVLVNQQETSEINTQTMPSSAGRPGLAAQGGVSNQPQSLNAAVASSTGKSEKDASSVNNRFATPGTDLTIRKAPLTPNMVTVSVALPYSYYEKIWLQQNPTLAGQPPKKPTPNELMKIETDERENIRKHVGRLLPLKEGQDPDKDTLSLVQVTTFQDLPVPEIAAPELSETALVWFERNWSALGTGLLGLVGLVMLRSVVKGVPSTAADKNEDLVERANSTAATTGEGGEAIAAEGGEGATAAIPAKRLLRRNRAGYSLRDELAEIVKEDPDTAASVLRSWISNAN